MRSPPLSLADLRRSPAEVARTLPAWERGEPLEAIAQTLRASAKDLFSRSYTAWVWIGADADGSTVWLLPVLVRDLRRFAPASPMNVLLRCLSAACETGAEPRTLEPLDWQGLVAVRCPGGDDALAPVALTDANPPPARVAVAHVPPELAVSAARIELTPVAAKGSGLRALARTLRAHPAVVAVALLEHGWRLDEPSYPPELRDVLRHRGYEGPAETPAAPSLAIDDDPCPRRRQARRALRRLLHKRKIGSGYHTAFDHLARGVAPEHRADALQLGEALIRAGLLGEKPSVGQRHVYLRRAALPEIHALIDRGETADPGLAAEWTAPPPGGGG